MGPTELKCLIAAGGTAGHVLPALAVAEELRGRGAAVTFAASPDRGEAERIAAAGFEVDTYAVRGIPRRPGAAQAGALAAAAAAPLRAAEIVRRRRPEVVLGGGGYVAGPVVLAAALLRVPAALMEADAVLGLANRLAAPFARRIFLAFPLAGRAGGKYRVVGRPIPARSRPVDPQEARRSFELPPDGPVLLVFGGSQGAHALNAAVVDAFAEEGPAVLHLAGGRDAEALAARVRRPDYRLLAFTDDFGAALAAADLVLARAGGSIWEVAAAARPALLVPYPHATADHQTKNAAYFEQGGGAVVVAEGALDVPRQVDELFADPDRLARMAEAMRRLAKPDAAAVVAAEVIALARS